MRNRYQRELASRQALASQRERSAWQSIARADLEDRISVTEATFQAPNGVRYPIRHLRRVCEQLGALTLLEHSVSDTIDHNGRRFEKVLGFWQEA